MDDEDEDILAEMARAAGEREEPVDLALAREQLLAVPRCTKSGRGRTRACRRFEGESDFFTAPPF